MTAEEYADQVKAELKDAWLPLIYRNRVLQMRTRSYYFGPLPQRPACEIQHTLLGVELKVGRRRLLCPDLATARYLSILARAGCENIAVPYDITKTSQLADEFESSWHRMLLLADRNAAAESDRFRTRLHGLLIAKLRAEVAAAGAGTARPEFKQDTKQRAN
ncbi:MAG TPA: hypothetical protein VFV61_06790 [Pyrinomonadaceae bacterium]|nr:hypothetical protein [Pyrinomonadaceae bacterium]